MLTVFSLILALGSASVFATGFSLMQTTCTTESGANYELHYWTSSPPGGPSSFHLDVKTPQGEISFSDPGRAQLVSATLLTARERGNSGSRLGHFLFYSRGDKSILDIALEKATAYNTPGPISVKCGK